jgi:pyridinium-3,5-biscarboxylic acid mononucleotide sulfurtransferase
MALSKTQILINYLKHFQPGGVAFSGGVDSTLLLYLARQAWTHPPAAVSFVSPLLTLKERDRIQKLSKGFGARLILLKTREYLDPQFKKNSPARCYYCKKSRFRQAGPLLQKKGISFLLDGTNADDLMTYRPGIRASREAKVISPLALMGWTKRDIRRVSRDLGLPTWDLPSTPCLATRIAYGQPISLPLLNRLSRGEEALLHMGFSQCRLRIHNSVVRIEVPEKEFKPLFDQKKRQELLSRLSALGFTYLTLDLKGFRSGSMDEGLKRRRRPIPPDSRP